MSSKNLKDLSESESEEEEVKEKEEEKKKEEEDEDKLNSEKVDYNELDKKSKFSLKTYLMMFKYVMSEWKMMLLLQVFGFIPSFIEI